MLAKLAVLSAALILVTGCGRFTGRVDHEHHIVIEKPKKRCPRCQRPFEGVRHEGPQTGP